MEELLESCEDIAELLEYLSKIAQLLKEKIETIKEEAQTIQQLKQKHKPKNGIERVCLLRDPLMSYLKPKRGN